MENDGDGAPWLQSTKSKEIRNLNLRTNGRSLGTTWSPLREASSEVMRQRLHACRHYIRILYTIPYRIELGIRTSPFCRAEHQVMRERLHPCRRNIRVLRA